MWKDVESLLLLNLFSWSYSGKLWFLLVCITDHIEMITDVVLWGTEKYDVLGLHGLLSIWPSCLFLHVICIKKSELIAAEHLMVDICAL
jgi:hypothetical protein